jgi:outer membrane protein insertion porin family
VISRFYSQVERIHVKGLGRTKDDLIANTVKDLYNLQDFQAVWHKATEIRTQLEKLGCFGSVTFHIEQSKQPNASPSDVEITFAVKELKRFQPLGLIDKDLGNNEVSAVAGGELPNLFGRGEKLQGLYTHGTKQSRGFNFTFTKPLHNKANTM